MTDVQEAVVAAIRSARGMPALPQGVLHVAARAAIATLARLTEEGPAPVPSPGSTRDADARGLVETAIDAPELRQVDYDVLIAVAEKVIETVDPEIKRLRARVAELEGYASELVHDVRTEWGNRWPNGEVLPTDEQHARAVSRRDIGPRLATVRREVRTGPWMEDE